MAKAISQPQITVITRFEVSEVEARALDALAGYGEDAFMKMFYSKCGSYYMKPYEQGMREFIRTIQKVVSPALNQVDEAREALRTGSTTKGQTPGSQ